MALASIELSEQIGDRMAAAVGLNLAAICDYLHGRFARMLHRSQHSTAASRGDHKLLRVCGQGLALCALQRPDEALVAESLSELSDLAGIDAQPVGSHVQRWGGGLPQYAVGHLERVARIRSAVDAVPGLAICGAAYDGVGIPAVIGSARRAVTSVTQAE